MSGNNGKRRQPELSLDDRIELGVRRYFERYLEDVLPRQIAAFIKAHDESAKAHGGVRRMTWYVKGLIAGIGLAAGAGAHHIAGLFR